VFLPDSITAKSVKKIPTSTSVGTGLYSQTPILRPHGFLLWTPMNRRAKFDAARFFLGGKNRNRTYTKNTNKQ